MNVFVELKLKPEKLDIHRINNLLTENINFRDNDELLDYTSLRFQILEDLKDAIIYVPLKPPMQYYYVSSPYGYRIHPKSKENKCIMVLIWLELGKKRLEHLQMDMFRFQEEMDHFGKTIKIVHKHGVTTLYGHLHRLSVKKGPM